MKKRNKAISKEEFMNVLLVLEKLNMDKSATARELGISRKTVYKAIEKYWNEYQGSKNTIIPKVQEVEAKRMVLSYDLEEQRIKVTEDIELVRKVMRERLRDEALRKKISNRDLIRYYEILLPYVAEKKITAGLGDGKEEMVSHTTFVQMITQKIQQSKNIEQFPNK